MHCAASNVLLSCVIVYGPLNIFYMYELIHTIIYMLCTETVLSGHCWLTFVNIVHCCPFVIY